MWLLNTVNIKTDQIKSTVQASLNICSSLLDGLTSHGLWLIAALSLSAVCFIYIPLIHLNNIHYQMWLQKNVLSIIPKLYIKITFIKKTTFLQLNEPERHTQFFRLHGGSTTERQPLMANNSCRGGWKPPLEWCIVTNLVSCALKAYLLTYSGTVCCPTSPQLQCWQFFRNCLKTYLFS